MDVYLVCAWYLRMSEEGVEFPGTGVADSCEQPHGCCEPTLGPLKVTSALNF